MTMHEPVDEAEITPEQLEHDPYPVYARLRASTPVRQLGPDRWLITSWDDCVGISGERGLLRGGSTDDDAFFGAPNVLHIEGEEHRALRAGIDVRLRPRAVNSYIEAAARPTVVRYLDEIRPSGCADLVTELFERISVRVVGDQLGLGDVDDGTLVRWFHTLSAANTAGAGTSGAAVESLAEIDDHLRDRIERLRLVPDQSIISHMLHGGIPEGGEPRRFEEIIASVRVIILGGFQEPGHAIGSTFLGLLGRPDQFAELVAAPSALAGPALQEGLRWIAPIGVVTRTATQDMRWRGHTIRAGSIVQLAVASANRDETRYDDPDTYDLHRMMLPNATFGYGDHFCAGHFLARAIGEIVIEETASRLAGLRLDPGGEAVVGGWVFRGAKHLPAVWEP